MHNYSLGPFFPYDGKPYPLLRHVLSLQPNGFALEFGVEKGLSLKIIAAHMPVIGFDAWAGLPENWRVGYPKGAFVCDPPKIPNTRLIRGWFADTLPKFRFDLIQPIGLIHFDADIYSSTKTALQYVGPHLQPGTYCIFDEWTGYPDCENHEQRAFKEFVEQTDINWDIIGHSEQSWAIQITRSPTTI